MVSALILMYDYGMGGNSTSGEFRAGFANNSRFMSDSDWRIRGYITADARSQTPYGTVRAYLDVGFNENIVGSPGLLGPNANRGFIQWAGFTFGEAVSFFDFYSLAAYAYLPSYPASTTGGGGWPVLGYTAQFGNGFSGTIAAEMRRDGNIVGQGTSTSALQTGTLAPGIGAGAGYSGFTAPDIVGNLRVDQAWGSAQIMGAAHLVSTTYYASSAPNFGFASGHPGDTWGWALAAGLKLNLPMLGHGDNMEVQVGYTEGALAYVFSPQISYFNWWGRDGSTAGYGIMTDAVFGGTPGGGNNTGLLLTSAWGVNAGLDHHWNDQWKTSVYGGYAQVNYGGNANAILCGLETGIDGTANGTGAGTSALATAGCDNDWSLWWIGSRTQWNITKDFYMGVDVLYTSLQSASTSNGVLPASQDAAFNGAVISQTVADQDAWSFEFRVHKNFYP